MPEMNNGTDFCFEEIQKLINRVELAPLWNYFSDIYKAGESSELNWHFYSRLLEGNCVFFFSNVPTEYFQ